MPRGFTLALFVCFGLVALHVIASREHRREMRALVVSFVPGTSIFD